MSKKYSIFSPLFAKENTMHENSRILGTMIEFVVKFSQTYVSKDEFQNIYMLKSQTDH